MAAAASSAEEEDELFDLAVAKYEKDLATQAESGPWPFNDEHRQLNRQVFTQVTDLIPFQDIHKTSDCDLIYRFLIARKWDVTVTVNNIREYIAWREKERIDEILWEHFEEELYEVFPYFRGFARNGYCVTYQKPNPKLLGKLLDKYSTEHLMRRNYYMLEQSRRLMARHGTDRMYAVYDIVEIGVGVITQPAGIAFFREMTKKTAWYYPELLRTLLVCRGGYTFTIAWKLIKPMLEERLQKKVQDVGTSEESMSAAISEVIDLSQVPPLYGGTGPQSVPLDPCLQECVDGTVAKGTGPLRQHGARTDLIFPGKTQQTVGKENGGKKVADSDDDLESCKSADVVVEEQQLGHTTNVDRAHATADHADDHADDEHDNFGVDVIISDALVEKHRQEHRSKSRESRTQQQQSVSNSPDPHPSSASAQDDEQKNTNRQHQHHHHDHAHGDDYDASSAAVPIKNKRRPVMHLPARAVHLYVHIDPDRYPEMRIHSRTQHFKRGAHAHDELVRGAPEVAKHIPGGPAYVTVGTKVMLLATAATGTTATVDGDDTALGNAAAVRPPPQVLAEAVGEAGHVLRRHMLVLDAQRRVHFMVQRATLHNEVRVFRPHAGLLPQVTQDKPMHFKGPEDRVMLARIAPLPGGKGAWHAVRAAEGEAAQSGGDGAGGETAQGMTIGECGWLDVRQSGPDVVSELFQLPRTHKFDRGSMALKQGVSVAFFREVTFEHEFVAAPAPVLIALVAAIDACFMQNS